MPENFLNNSDPMLSSFRIDQVQMRWMIRRDMVDVVSIENDAHRWPDTDEDLLLKMRERNTIPMVAEWNPREWGERIVGFVIYSLHPQFIDIRNFCVSADFRRLGIGSLMIQKMMSKLQQQRRESLRVVVRESNVGLQLFLRHAGFLATRTIRDHFEDPAGEDAIAFECRSRSI